MSFKKKMLAFVAVGALTAATAVPAMAFENEFHGMYRVFGFATNAETGGATFNLNKGAKDTFFAEQRARLMYIAKANDNLKLVTHFELDTRFGGQDTATGAAASNKYPIGDGGAIDADRISLETKNIYLDFNIPQSTVNFKVGLQPFSDAFEGVFTNMDAAGVAASAKFGGFTPTIGWFRLSDNNYRASTATTNEVMPGKQTLDMAFLDGKFAVNKDLSLGASYYFVRNDQNVNPLPPAAQDPNAVTTIAAPSANYELFHMIGLNGKAKVGPAALSAFLAYQIGDFSNNTATTSGRKLRAAAAAAMAKVAVGPGTLNATALYLSGDKNPSNAGTQESFRQLTSNGTTSYFAPANMWLLIRNSAMINSSTAIGGTDLTKGNVGLIGFFGGYEVTQGKLLASANIGFGKADQKGAAESANIGTELNATIGYKIYDNLTASLTAAYLILGDGARGSVARLPLAGAIGSVGNTNAADASNPYLGALQLNYVF